MPEMRVIHGGLGSKTESIALSDVASETGPKPVRFANLLTSVADLVLVVERNS
jgi:hypothetical protein